MFGDGFLCFVRQICHITWSMVCVQSYLEVRWAKVYHIARYVTYKCGRVPMSVLSWSRTLRRRRFVKTGVWILIIVVMKIRIQYSGVPGFLRSVDWWLSFGDKLSHIQRTYMLYRNVDNYQSALCNISEERRSHLHRGGSLKSRKNTVLCQYSENFTFCRGVPQNFLTDVGIVHLNGGRLLLPLSLFSVWRCIRIWTK
jgi:hypothetical protein